jgi:hypothetical protein
MKSRNVFFIAGMLAAFIVALVGCVNPLSYTEASWEAPSADAPASGGEYADVPSTGVQPEEFTVTLGTGAGGGSRAVAGPGAGTVRYGSIRNTLQVIVVNQAGNTVVDFKQVRRTRDIETGATIAVENVVTGGTYHFLVLMGHQERDYDNESGGIYKYKTGQAPTLLAAGFTTATISGAAGETITVTMNPVVVDTVFEYDNTMTGAALAGVTLCQGVTAELIWTVTSGFAPLINAQKKISGKENENTLLFKAGKTIVRHGVTVDEPPVNSLDGINFNAITLADIGTTAVGDGSANFNLKYVPFNLIGTAWGSESLKAEVIKEASDPVWIIRNGINDEAQNNYTVFLNPAETSSCPWNGTGGTKYNGNGAVRFSVAGIDQDLTRYIPAPVTGGTPVMSFAGPQYTGMVEWTDVTVPAAPIPSITVPFAVQKVYQAKVTLTPASGWTFNGVGKDTFTHGTTPAPTVSAITNDAKSGVVTITFLATTAVTALKVTDTNLTPYIAVPVRGGTPVMYFAGAQYRGEVTWWKGSGFGTEHSGVFGDGTQYKAIVKLTAASGYTFDGFTGHFQYNVAGVTVDNDTNPSGVGITFNATEAIQVKVTDLSLTGKVSAPVAGVMPGTTVFGTQTQYTGTVLWSVTGSTGSQTTPFAASTLYTATLTLNAAPGYTFNGIPEKPSAAPVAGSFTYSGGTITHGLGSGTSITVTIDFPVTAGPKELAPTSFGKIGTTGSALYYMNQRKDGGPLTLKLPSGTESLNESVFITRAAGKVNTPRTVTIDGGNRTLKAESAWGTPFITLKGDGYAGGLVVTLTNITIQGGSNNLDAPLVKLEDKAKLVLGSNAIIEGNTNNSTTGGGVSIGPGSVLEMGPGSKIKDNNVSSSKYGGGVYNEGGTFTMYSGSKLLDNNKAVSAHSGGGVYIKDGTFTMEAGSEISGSSASQFGGAVYAGGSSTVVQISGDITGNTAGTYGSGVFLSWGLLVMSGGLISENTTTGSSGGGSGVYVTGADANFLMSGGLISGNDAKGSNGGGVYVSDGTFKMTGGKIKENKAVAYGGGVYVRDGTFEMWDSEISSNEVSGSSGGGGGVAVKNSSVGLGTFTMKNGAKIFQNKALSAKGGGVLVYSDGGTGGTFTMQNNSRIYENQSKNGGGGVTFDKGTFSMAAGSSISYNRVMANDGATEVAGGLYIGAGVTGTGPLDEVEVAGVISGNKVEVAGLVKSSGGGLYNASPKTFKLMSGGAISYNEVTGKESGGGVCNIGTFTMEIGSSIDHNRAYSKTTSANESIYIGGGVYNLGTFRMEKGGASISDNEANYNESTGKYVCGGLLQTSGTFDVYPLGNITGSSITNNKAGGISNCVGALYQTGGTLNYPHIEIVNNIPVNL